MRHIKSIFGFFALLLLLVVLNSCLETAVETKLTVQQEAAVYLSEHSPWGGPGNVIINIKPNGVDVSQLANLQLTFTSSPKPEYLPEDFIADGADVFLRSDNTTWSWVGTDTDLIALSNASSSQLSNVVIDKQNNKLTFSFEIEGNGGGRTTGLNGYYNVTLDGQ